MNEYVAQSRNEIDEEEKQVNSAPTEKGQKFTKKTSDKVPAKKPSDKRLGVTKVDKAVNKTI